MHPRNRYHAAPPDFAALAAAYPDTFGRFVVTDVRGRSRVNFGDEAALRALTQVLLRHDFGLDWELPAGHLCPPVPNRLNYLHWVEDLLVAEGQSVGSDGSVRALDIGTGASAVFPLLGTAMHAHWCFVGTDVDAQSLAHARLLLQRNRLEDRIDLCVVRAGDAPLLLPPPPHSDADADADANSNADAGGDGDADADADAGTSAAQHAARAGSFDFDFCVCNPPFFDDESDAARLSDRIGARADGGVAGASATKSERLAEGGEVGFVARLVDASLAAERASRAAFAASAAKAGPGAGARPRPRAAREEEEADAPGAGADAAPEPSERSPAPARERRRLARCRVYTTMLGRKASLRALLALLRRRGVPRHATRSTALVQGRTRRWAMAWCLHDGGSLQSLHGAGADAPPCGGAALTGDAPASGLGTAAHVAAGDVFGARKEARRRSVFAFAVVPSTTTACSVTSEEIAGRVRETLFGGGGGDGSGGGDASAPRFRCREVPPPAPGAMPASPAVRGVRRIRAATCADSRGAQFGFVVAWRQWRTGDVAAVSGAASTAVRARGWYVEVTFETGERSARARFWQLCDVLRRDVSRTGRRWARLLLKRKRAGKPVHGFASDMDS
eukprot:g3507.t1